MSKRLLTTATLFAVVILILTASNVCFADNLTSAKAAALVDVESGRTLFEKNGNERLPLASTTKIVTALTTILFAPDLDKKVCVDKNAVGIEGSSIYLREGEVLSIRELLFGLMLQSGNDCAVQLALTVGGSVEDFALLMNATATRCGATNSHFVNPHGLHNDEHYTTAVDLAKISAYALKNSEFSAIVSSKTARVGDRTISNKNRLLKSWELCDGVKTGFTRKAGRCFVGSATKNGMRLVAVVLNCGPMFEESRNMLEYGLSHYTIANIVSKNCIVASIVKEKKITFYRCDKGFRYPLAENERNKIRKEVAFLSDGEVFLKVYLGKQLIFSQKLLNM